MAGSPTTPTTSTTLTSRPPPTAALHAVLFGLLISLPLAVVAHRVRPLRGVLLGISNVLFTIPSIAIFVLLLPVTGLTRTTAIIGPDVYTLVVLLRNTVEGLDSVPAKAARHPPPWARARCAPCSRSSCRSPSR